LEPDLTVIATAATGKEALALLKSATLPDVILLDIRMTELDGVATVKLIKQDYPDIKVIVLTTFNDAEYVMEALANGANGYLLKDTEIEQLVEAIHDALKEKMVLPPLVAAQLAQGLHNIVPKKTRLLWPTCRNGKKKSPPCWRKVFPINKLRWRFSSPKALPATISVPFIVKSESMTGPTRYYILKISACKTDRSLLKCNLTSMPGYASHKTVSVTSDEFSP
jgi:CheY-like chemotaxis protein